MPSPRRKKIRDAALGLTVGRWVDKIEHALDAHVDQGRDLSEEAHEVLRQVLETMAREDLGDKVVFMESGTFAIDEELRKVKPEDDDWPTQLPRAAREASDECPIEAVEEAVVDPEEGPLLEHGGEIKLPSPDELKNNDEDSS